MHTGRALLTLALALSLPGCQATFPRADGPPEETVASVEPLRIDYRVRRDRRTLWVDVDLHGTVPPSWWFPMGGRRVLSLEAVTPSERTLLHPDAEGVVALPPGTTSLRYAYPARTGGLKDGTGSDGGVVLSGSAYLLRPEWIEPDVTATLRADDLQTSWAPDPSGAVVLDQERLLNPGFHTFGGDRETLQIAGGTVALTTLPGHLDSSADERRAWVAQAVRELAGLRSELPWDRLALTLVPSAGTRSASSFGMILFSQPPSIALYVGSRARAAEFEDDWVLIHELCHSLHPRIRPRNAWFTEGIATYLSYVARIRSGRMTDQQGWQAIVNGVWRGLRQVRGRGLQQLSDSMHDTHAYGAVYWGGACLALDMDRTLRHHTDGRHGLEDLLEHLTQDDFDANLDQVRHTFDQLAGPDRAAELASRHFDDDALTHAWTLLAHLGVDRDGTLDPDLDAARRQLTHPD